MSRILVAWELGLNSGHVTRLLPLCMELKRQGHVVIAAVRSLRAAAPVLGAVGIECVQAPICADTFKPSVRAASYADILLSQGWGRSDTLRGLLAGWRGLFNLFRPDIIVADFSPTAQLEAWSSGLPVICIGNGFDLPPLHSPLPPFPGFSWTTPKRAERAEEMALYVARQALPDTNSRPLVALRDVFRGTVRLLATYPELDHYGSRVDQCYVGAIGHTVHHEKIRWNTRGQGERIFAYLRSDTPLLTHILNTLSTCSAEVICVAPDVPEKELTSFCGKNFRVHKHPVEIKELIPETSLCVTYGAGDTVARFLLGGCPQLLAPRLVEPWLTTRRVLEMGAGRQISEGDNVKKLAHLIQELFESDAPRDRAEEFSRKYAKTSVETNQQLVDAKINSILDCCT